MEVGLVRSVDITEQMRQAYLSYAMSVIVARALPDARDGLKPVQRRILYAMYDMGLRPNAAFKKSARIVGEVLGKYHPHGDQAVYDAMVRMAQPFVMRYPLVEGQGNFGSVDGDPPAAMRYTEARLAQTAMEMLADIPKDTVDFAENFDGSLTEPTVLPAALPNLLLNGAAGIAVGMATNIPPHNLNEIVDALVYMLDNWRKLDSITVEDLTRFVKGPDFPTGGMVIVEEGRDELLRAYSTGRGKLTVRARVHLEAAGRGRQRLVITELPYAVNKTTLLERIAHLARENKIEGIADLRDESDRQGLRVVVELAKGADPDEVLTRLYKHTPLQNTFGVIMLALVGGEPRLLSLKQALRVYLEHRLEVVRRRSEHDLRRLRKRAHILEGLLIALDNLDEVIATIRRSRTVETAHQNLRRKFKLSAEQAQAILDMPLRRLAALERRKLQEEYRETKKHIRSLEALLRSPKKMRQAVAEELTALKARYGDPRRTQIVHLKAGQAAQALTAEDLIPAEEVWVGLDAEGNLARMPVGKTPRLSGRAAPWLWARASTRDTLYLVAENGQAVAVPVHTLPEADKLAGGASVSRVTPLPAGQEVVALFAVPPNGGLEEGGGYVLTVTRQGMVKKSDLTLLPGPATQPFTLVKVNPGDALLQVLLTRGEDEVVLVTARGMAIRFAETDVRPMGLVAAGVNGIKLKGDDVVVGAVVVHPKRELFLVDSRGYAKRVPFDEFPLQRRYGQGVVAWKLPKGAILAGCATGKGTQKVVLHLHKAAPKSVRLDEAPVRTRASVRGVRVVDLKTGDSVVWVAALSAAWPSPRGRRRRA